MWWKYRVLNSNRQGSKCNHPEGICSPSVPSLEFSGEEKSMGSNCECTMETREYLETAGNPEVPHKVQGAVQVGTYRKMPLPRQVRQHGAKKRLRVLRWV